MSKLKELNKKTDWIFPFYFHIIHVLGLIFGSILITTLFIIFPNIELIYRYIIAGIIFLLLLIFSCYISHKKFRKGIIIATIILFGAGILGYIIKSILK